MRRPSSDRPRLVAALVTLTLGLSGVMAAEPECRVTASWSEQAIDDLQDGHAERSLAVLKCRAETGDPVAMERLALLHWYGGALYPASSAHFSRDIGLLWFRRAADRGSELGRHMSNPPRQARSSAN